MTPYLLAIDQGTTSTRAILFDAKGRPLAQAARTLAQIYPRNGWVEHDAAAIWQDVRMVCRKVLAQKPGARIEALGLTNQRETCLIWDRVTGKPLHNAIVWQDRRTADACDRLKAQGWDRKITARTGLLLDPYFSATKLQWLLGHVPGVRARAARGDILFGTIDSWLLWNLTGGKLHATDVTNAARTMLADLGRMDWDSDLLKLFGVPRAMLPQIRDSAGDFGHTDPKLFGKEIPIRGIAGDQQAAAIGQACLTPGDAKATYGTGCFLLVNSGTRILHSRNRLLATALYRRGETQRYAIEGSIFIAGAVVQWLRDAARMIPSADAIEDLARAAAPAEGLYFVPAFTGLGAPYWDTKARGLITGLTRDMGAGEIARAGLDAVCYQTRDLLEAVDRDLARAGLKPLKRLKVDGGMVKNDWFCQRLADLTGRVVERPVVTETTALGAALLAGLGVGLFRTQKAMLRAPALDRRFAPVLGAATRDRLYAGWKRAVARARG